MKNIEELADEALATIREQKEDTIREEGPDVNVPPTILIFRDDVILAMAHLVGEVSSERIKRAMWALGGGLRADAIVLASESWQRVGEATRFGEINPATGQVWGEVANDMSLYVQKYGRDGTVRDSVMIMVVKADGSSAARMRTFTPTRSSFGWTVQWDDEVTKQDDFDRMGGAMWDLARQALSEGGRMKVELARQADKFGMRDEEEALAVADGVIVRECVAGGLAWVAMVEEPGTRRAEVLQRTLGNPPFGTLSEAMQFMRPN